MQIYFIILILFFVKLIAVIQSAEVVCYVDTSSSTKITSNDVENALDHCTHLVYGFATLTPRFFTLTFDGSVDRSLKLTDIAVLKKKYPRIKFLLSLGGDRDVIDPLKYLQLLEATPEEQTEFIMSCIRVMRFYEFDGLDLAFQLPRNEPQKSINGAVQFWRRLLRKAAAIDSKALEYKNLLTNFISTLGNVFKAENKLLTLSVLPNVNSSLYFDIPGIMKYVNLVTLWAFDFNTPSRNRKEADYPAPLMPPPNTSGYRLSYNNVHFQVQYWLSQTEMANKIILGVPAFARTWTMFSKSARNAAPIVSLTYGPSERGAVSQTPGLLSWPEVCDLLKDYKRKVRGSMQYGQYFVCPPHDNFTHSTWIAFDGPNVAYFKGLYARTNRLGGMALVDLAMDDFKGECSGSQFPTLKYMNGLFN